jgi:hypothetical protein
MIETAKRDSCRDKPRFKLLAEAAMELRKGDRWLRDWLRQNPCDARGEAYYRLAGRTKLFTDYDIDRPVLDSSWVLVVTRCTGSLYCVRQLLKAAPIVSGWVFSAVTGLCECQEE